MKRLLLPLACTLLMGGSALAKPPAKGGKSLGRATFRYTPPPAKSADAEQRPVVVEGHVTPRNGDFALRLRFDKVPWGEECKTRCANATVFIDTDASAKTGLKLSKGAPENGADLAVIVQGVRDYKDEGADTFLRVKVRQLADGTRSVEEGDALAELSHRTDPERVQVDGHTVTILVDATSPTLPSARRARAIYHPPGGKAVQGSLGGMVTGGAVNRLKGVEQAPRAGPNGAGNSGGY